MRILQKMSESTNSEGTLGNSMEMDKNYSTKNNEVDEESLPKANRENARSSSSSSSQSYRNDDKDVNHVEVKQPLEKFSVNSKGGSPLQDDELKLNKTLGSISKYTKQIRNFIGLDPEDPVENSDTESAIDNMSRSTSRSNGNSKIMDKLCESPSKVDDDNNKKDIISTESGETDRKEMDAENKLDNFTEKTKQNLPAIREKHPLVQRNNGVDCLSVQVDKDKKISEDGIDHHVLDGKIDVLTDQLNSQGLEKIPEYRNNCVKKSRGTKILDEDFYEVDEIQDKTIPSEYFLEDESPISISQYGKQGGILASVEYMDPDTICGIGSFKPQWMQKYATAKSYLVFYSIIGILQGTYFTYLIGCLTTLEKRYAFKSKISGTIMMLDEITPLLMGILVGYFGGKTHRPRIVAFGMFMSTLCSLISALPYFMYGPSQQLMANYIKNNTNTEYCDMEMKYEQCDADDRPPTFTAVACLFIGSFFRGFGNLTYYAVGMSYMDDNTKKKNTPIYFGISMALRMLGPIIGFVMSSYFLKFYENPFGDPGYNSDDPRWIGAWWLGFVLQAVLLFIFSIPILFFPKRLPRQRLRAFSNTRDFDLQSNRERMKGLFAAVNRLLKNPVFIAFTFGTIFSIISSYGYFTMLPKYLETQFRLSASDASIISGPPAITSAQVMTIVGGLLIYRIRPKAKALLTCLTITEANWIVGCFILMWPACRNLLLAGTSMTNEGLLLQNDCNSECLCATTAFNPICGPDGISTYFSPCHAGCEAINSSSLGIIGNCSCLQNSSDTFVISNAVTRGICPLDGCWTKAVTYVCILTLLSGVAGIFRVAYTMVLLRSVDAQDKSLALGLFETFVCGCAFIPLPLIFGALADAACLVWEKSCDEFGNCWLYDVDKFNYLLHGMSALFSGFSLICYAIVIFLSHRIKDLYEDELCEFEVTDASKTATSQSISETVKPV